jgi:hypothetical protein
MLTPRPPASADGREHFDVVMAELAVVSGTPHGLPDPSDAPGPGRPAIGAQVTVIFMSMPLSLWLSTEHHSS